MKLYLFSTLNRNFPQDTPKLLEQGEITFLRFESLQDMMEAPQIEGSGLYLMEIGSQEDFARAQVAAEWVSVLRPQSRFIFLLASKNLKIPEGLGPMIDSLSLPLPAKSFFFKLQLAQQLLHQPAPKVAVEKTPLPFFRGTKVTRKEIWIEGPTGGSKAGRWQGIEEGRSSKVRWRWIPSDPFDRSLTFGLSWVAEAPEPPEWNEELGKWKLALAEEVSLKAWRGGEELCNLKPESMPVDTSFEATQENLAGKNISLETLQKKSEEFPNFSSEKQMPTLEVSNKKHPIKETEVQTVFSSPSSEQGREEKSKTQFSKESAKEQNPGESAPKENNKESEELGALDQVNLTNALDSNFAFSKDISQGIATKETRSTTVSIEEKIIIKNQEMSSFLNQVVSVSVLPQKKSSPSTSQEEEEVRNKSREAQGKNSTHDDEKESKMLTEKDVSLDGPPKDKEIESSEGPIKSIKEMVMESAGTAKVRRVMEVEEDLSSEHVVISAAVQDYMNPIKENPFEDQAAKKKSQINIEDKKAGVPKKNGSGAVTPNEASQESSRPTKESQAPLNQAAHKKEEERLLRDSDFKFADPKNTIQGEKAETEGSVRKIPVERAGWVTIRVGGTDKIKDQLYDPVKKRKYYLFSLYELSDNNSIWYPLTATRVYLSAEARYKDATKLRLFPIWTYTGNLAPEFLEELRLWKFYDNPPACIGSLEDCRGELREFMEKLMHSGFILDEEIIKSLERIKQGELSLEKAEEQFRAKGARKGFFQWLVNLLKKWP